MEIPIAKELDFTENWVNNLDKTVLKGAKIRDEKLKSHPSNTIDQYDVVDIDFDQPSCSKTSKSYKSFHLQRPLKTRKLEHSLRSLSPQKRKKRHKKLKKHKHNNGGNTYGMRIAELAVPSKRHCIQTWRDRWDTLPINMLDRLRQIVMDQKPIVPIQDAIACFKQNKTNFSRSPYKENKTVKNEKIKEIELLCGIFGFRISAQLQAPRNVTLSTGLIPLSHVINDEISRLLKKRKMSNSQQIIQREIVNKITNWIADVLEQSTYNLMLEDYFELEKEEGHIWDIIDELVDNAALLCKDSSHTSSEVIDAESSDSNPSLIDDDTTVSSESDSSDDDDEFENIIWNIIEKIFSNNIQTQDIDNVSRDLDDIKERNSKTLPETIEKYVKNFLYNYIDEIFLKDEEVFEDADHFEVSDSDLNNDLIPYEGIQNTIQNSKENNDEEKERNDFNRDINNSDNPLNDDSFTNEALKESNNLDNNLDNTDIMESSSVNIPKDLFDKSGIEDAINTLPHDNEDTDTVIMNNEIKYINNEDETNLRIDETMPLTDVTSDDSIKKVKFSNIYMDSEQRQLNSKSNIRDGDNKKSGTQGIFFAPPNENLLSDADESWPENLRFPTVKPTVSISKSILSLGKITEDEEKTKDLFINKDEIRESNADFFDTNNNSLLETEDFIETNNVASDRNLQQDIDENMVLNKNQTVENLIDENLTNKDILKTNNLEKAGKIVSNIIKKVLINISQSNGPILDKNLIDKNISQASQEGDVGSAELKDKAVETKRHLNLLVTQMPAITIGSEISTRNIQCCGNSSKINERTQTIPDENCQNIETENRIWCKGLQNVVQNLEMWLDWVDNTCSNLLYLKHKEKLPPCHRRIQKHNIRKWIILKTNIDADARLWEKLSISLQVGLRSYKCFYPPNKDLIQIRPTRPDKNHQHRQREQQHRMEKICTCIWVHHGPLNPRVVHL